MADVLNQAALLEVFSVCDDDKDGFISIERFIQVAKENFNQWETNEYAIVKIANLLNGGNNGLINFDDFCNGIAKIFDLNDIGCRKLKEDDVDSGAWSSKSQETPKPDCLASLDEFFYEDEASEVNFNSTPNGGGNYSQISNFSAPQSRTGSFRRNLAPYNSNRSFGAGYNIPSHSRNSSLSEGVMDDIDQHYNQLSDKVTKLEEQLQMMNECQLLDGQIRNKLKDENSSYIHRIHLLEEQLREVELTSEERFLEEQKKRDDFIAKTDKDKTNQIEILTESLRLIEKEYKILLEEAPIIKSENEKLKKINSRLIMEQQQLESRLAFSESELENQQNYYQSELKKITEERKLHSQLVDELSDELRDLRHSKSLHTSTQDSKIPRSARKEIELQVSNIRQENIDLRLKVDDLQGQLLQRQLNDGFQLIGDKHLNSLASEISTMSKDELLRMINSEQDRNRKLTEYIDDVLLRILESNPNLLEIPSKIKSK